MAIAGGGSHPGFPICNPYAEPQSRLFTRRRRCSGTRHWRQCLGVFALQRARDQADPGRRGFRGSWCARGPHRRGPHSSAVAPRLSRFARAGPRVCGVCRDIDGCLQPGSWHPRRACRRRDGHRELFRGARRPGEPWPDASAVRRCLARQASGRGDLGCLMAAGLCIGSADRGQDHSGQRVSVHDRWRHRARVPGLDRQPPHGSVPSGDDAAAASRGRPAGRARVAD